MDEAYRQTLHRGGSGRGVSYWSVPAMCGRKLRLTEEHADAAGLRDNVALDTGTYYHSLLEQWRAGTLPDDAQPGPSDLCDLEYGEAWRLFSFYREYYTEDYFGEIVAVELRMPINDAHTAAIKEWLGHDEMTGQCDLVVKMSAEDVARVEKDRGIELGEPGIYIVDYKTSGARKSDTDAAATYTSSIQALAYMHMLQLAFNEPVRGIIFDVMVKHKQLREKAHDRQGSSIQTFFARPRAEDGRIVRAAIEYGKRQREENKANPYACFEYGRPCVFLSRGICGRY